MASRRLRIKAVANVPIRRGKVTEQEQTGSDRDCIPVQSPSVQDPLPSAILIAGQEMQNITKIKPNVDVNSSLGEKAVELSSNGVLNLVTGEEKFDVALSSCESDPPPTTQITETLGNDSVVGAMAFPESVKCARKRINPSVTLSSVVRKGREMVNNKDPTLGEETIAGSDSLNASEEHEDGGDKLVEFSKSKTSSVSADIMKNGIEENVNTAVVAKLPELVKMPRKRIKPVVSFSAAGRKQTLEGVHTSGVRMQEEIKEITDCVKEITDCDSLNKSVKDLGDSTVTTNETTVSTNSEPVNKCVEDVSCMISTDESTSSKTIDEKMNSGLVTKLSRLSRKLVKPSVCLPGVNRREKSEGIIKKDLVPDREKAHITCNDSLDMCEEKGDKVGVPGDESSSVKITETNEDMSSTADPKQEALFKVPRKYVKPSACFTRVNRKERTELNGTGPAQKEQTEDDICSEVLNVSGENKDIVAPNKLHQSGYIPSTTKQKDASDNVQTLSELTDTIKLPKKRIKPSISLANVKRRERGNTSLQVSGGNEGLEVNSTVSLEAQGTNITSKTPNSEVVSNPEVSHDSVLTCTLNSKKNRVSRPSYDQLGVSAIDNSTNSSQDTDLPADSENTNDSQKNSSTVNTFRSRFIRPKPRLLDSVSRHCKRNAESSSESDSEKKALSDASTLSPPWQPNLSASRLRPHQLGITDVNKTKTVLGSASESEDDRSVLSVASTVSPPRKIKKLESKERSTPLRKAPTKSGCVTDIEEPTVKKSRSKPVKTYRRKEYQRIVEIKKEIVQKLENGKINKSRLTMFELIYYNPVTNPMKSTHETTSNKENTPAVQIPTENEERLAEESVDEPSLDAEENKDEESVAMPVPQVKVGPNGEIILDEQSLVIETTGAKKNRNDLQNSAVVMDYGNGSTTFNAYSKKRKNRTKEWTREETLRFYRALQTVGTDFLVMQSLFPKFTRRELKDKFKKEERINPDLIRKALCNPLTFDLTELQKTFDLERQEEDSILKKKAEHVSEKRRRSTSFRNMLEPQRKEDKSTKRFPKIRRKRKVSAESSDDGQPTSSDTEKRRQKKLPHIPNETPCVKERMRKAYISALNPSQEVAETPSPPGQVSKSSQNENSLEDIYSENDSDNQEALYLLKPPKPTRSGRIPQKKYPKNFTTAVKSVKEERVEVQEFFEEDVSVASNDACAREENFIIAEDAATFSGNQVQLGSVYENVKPGTLIVLATESPDNPGQQIYNIFMVSGENNKTVPVSITNSDTPASDKQGGSEFVVSESQEVPTGSGNPSCHEYAGIYSDTADMRESWWPGPRQTEDSVHSCHNCEECDCAESEENIVDNDSARLMETDAGVGAHQGCGNAASEELANSSSTDAMEAESASIACNANEQSVHEECEELSGNKFCTEPVIAYTDGPFRFK